MMNRGLSISYRAGRSEHENSAIVITPLQPQQQQQQQQQQVPMMQQETYANVDYSNHSNSSYNSSMNKTAVSVQVPMNFDRKLGNQIQVIIISYQ